MASADSNVPNDVSLIIRAAGERTEEACRRLAERQVGAGNVVVLHEKPFSRAVMRSLEVGIEAGRPWTVLLDADILLAPGDVDAIVARIADTPDDTYLVLGRTLCKFHGGSIPGGLKAVRTSLLDEALATTRAQEGSLLPEAALNHAMAARGNALARVPDIWGIHDYEQSYRHIFLKMVARARKSSREAPMLLARAEELSGSDPDFRVAAWGLRVGLAAAGDPGAPREYDWENDFPEFELMLKEAGLSPKPPLDVARALRMPEDILAREPIRTAGDLLHEFEGRTGRRNTSRGLLARIGRRFLAWDETLRKRRAK